VELPDKKISDLACALKIAGSNFKPAPIMPTAMVVTPDAKGRLILSADDATLHGKNLKLEEQGGRPCIGYWDKADEWVSWNAQFDKAGMYQISAVTATISSDAAFVFETGGQTVNATAPPTGGWDKFTTNELGTVEIKQPGSLAVKVRAADAAGWKAINLNSVMLVPVPQP
jgi:alpha-L-fucosidase